MLFVLSDCNAVFTDDYSVFASPGYAHSGMKAGTQCSYTIHAEDDRTIYLMYMIILDSALCNGECCSYVRVSNGAYKVSVSGRSLLITV